MKEQQMRNVIKEAGGKPELSKIKNFDKLCETLFEARDKLTAELSNEAIYDYSLYLITHPINVNSSI